MYQDNDNRPSTCQTSVRSKTGSQSNRQGRSNRNYEKKKIEHNTTVKDNCYYSPEQNDINEVFSDNGLRSPNSKEKPISSNSIQHKRIYSSQRSDLTSAKANSIASTHYKTFNGTFYTSGGNKNPMDFSKFDTIKFIDGMYQDIPLWRQSVATWRHAAASHKFPKAQRFVDPKLPGTYQNKINIPTSIKKRSTSFGFGKNTDIFPPKHIEKASTTPAPNEHKVKRYLEDQNHYKIRYPPAKDLSNTLFKQRSCSKSEYSAERQQEKRSNSQNYCLTQGIEPGKSFGISYEHYRKNYLKYADKIIYSPLFQENNPPPDAYDVREKIGEDKRKYSIYQRLKMFNEYCDKQIPPVTKYEVNEKSVVQSRFDDISFGFGQKINIAKPLNDNPGTQYAVKRDFDEFDKYSNHYMQF